MMRQSIRALTLTMAALALFMAGAGVVRSQEVTIPATTSGYWDQFGKHIQRSTDYECGRDGRYVYNCFFVFDLADVTGTITGAVLLLENPANGFNSIDSPLTITFVNVVTPIEELTARTDRSGSRVDIWEDLGGMKPNNVIYGEYDATSNDDGRIIAVELTNDAVADLNAAIGQQLAIGGSITNLVEGDSPQEVFNGTASPRRIRQLVLTVAP
jgi:hypothetical protein